MDARINENREACIQADGTGAEDCLYLDIVKPDSIPPDTLLPIYFWIHGGSFRNGAAAYYPGDALAYSEEIIVVTIQYRLGPLGFLNYPRSMGSEVPLNIGLHDQRMALKFIYDHAESIGGDPNRITVAGESAGSISVSAHAFAPPSSQFIAQTIQQSGTAALGSPAEWTNLNIQKLVKDLCESLSCPASDDFDEIIRYLRTIEFGSDDFTTMYFALSSSGADIITDDREFFGGETLQEIIDAKSFKVMPTVIFFVAFEGYVSIDTFPAMYNKDNFMDVWTDDMFLTLLMSHNNLTNEDKKALTWRSFGRMSCDFPDETPASFEEIDNTTAVRVALDIIGDLLFRGPSVKCASEYHEVGADTWVMHFDTIEDGSMLNKVLGESLGPMNHNDSSPLWSKERV
jgi:carboxylesterase type B